MWSQKTTNPLAILGAPGADKGAALVAGAIQVVDNVAALRAITPSAARKIRTAGVNTPGDGGGGDWIAATGAAAGTYTDNTGTVVLPTGGDGSAAWLRLNADVINVRWFGVTEGAADGTAGINAALQIGGTVTLDGVTATVTGITAAVAGTKLTGPGKLLLKSGSNSNLLTISADDVEVRNLEIDGNRSGQTAICHAVYITGNRVKIDGNFISNAYTYGVLARDCFDPIIRNNEIRDTGNIALFVETTVAGTVREGALIEGNIINRESLGTGITEGGIKIHGNGVDAYMNRCRIIGNKVQMPVNPTAGAAICIEVWGLAQYSVISGNTTNGGSMAISVDKSSGSTITGNTCYNFNTYGIELAASDLCAVSGNTVDGGGIASKGITLTNTYSEFNAITGNTIKAVNGNAIHLNAGSNNNSISNNNIQNPVGTALNIAGCENVTISGNIVDGLTTGTKAVLIDKSSAVTISGNTFRNFTQNGVLLYGTSTYTIDEIRLNGNIFASTNGMLASQLSGGAVLGASITAVGNSGNVDYLNYRDNVQKRSSTADPEGVYTAGPGSVYYRRTGGAGTTLYIKESGTGNTGWIAK